MSSSKRTFMTRICRAVDPRVRSTGSPRGTLYAGVGREDHPGSGRRDPDACPPLCAGTESASIFQGTNTQDQTANGTQNSRAFAILQMITGNINNPGGWVISPRLILDRTWPFLRRRLPSGLKIIRLFYEIWGRKEPLWAGGLFSRQRSESHQGADRDRRKSPSSACPIRTPSGRPSRNSIFWLSTNSS